ncbi:MAG: hypothetical protein F4X08_15810 [Gemmatimonadetes bacterium]|nr:hypothetical protein [Gemmatimonadota bacterium]MYD27266.1 hypothetical protein [Gemmatimonadota bacterium]MYI99044.1 hypothetical protein [Gemmatimonadota bacterium]
MRRKHNLRLARAIQCISGVLAVLTIYPLVRLIYPCWRRLKGRGNHGETGGKGDDRETGGPHPSGPSEPHGGPSGPSGKSTAQGK